MLRTYLTNFLQRAGAYIFGITVLARIFSFVGSWLALQLLPNKALGTVLFSWTIFSFITPLIGLGLHQGYIRYGALESDASQRSALLHYVVKKGVQASVVLAFFVGLIAFFIPFSLDSVAKHLLFFLLSLPLLFLIEILKIKARLAHDNKRVAFIEGTYQLLLLLCIAVFSVFWSIQGYLLAFVIAPSLTLGFYTRDFNNVFKTPQYVPTKGFWSFGIYAALSNVATMLLFSIDMLLLGELLHDPEMVTLYRYLSLIPFSLLFLPRVFMTTDFVSITENIYNHKATKNYIYSYLKLFTIISTVLFFGTYLFRIPLLRLFDPQFHQYATSFTILMFGICGILLLRGLFGNLLSSIGLARTNYYLTLIAISLNLLSNYYLIPRYHILGAAITTASIMWFTGIASAWLFYYNYNKKIRTSLTSKA